MQHSELVNDAVGSTASSTNTTKISGEQVFCGRDICGDLEQVESREFLVSNGKGGYASLTAACSLTRSYHGLLIAALRTPLERTLLLTNLTERTTYQQHVFHLSTGRRTLSAHTQDATCGTLKSQLVDGDVMCPLGFMHLESFRLEGTIPVFTYTMLDALLEKRLWMKQGENTVFVSYYLCNGSDAVDLDLSAYVNHRDHHHRTCGDAPHFRMKSELLGDSTVRVHFNTKDKAHTVLVLHTEKGTASLDETWMKGIVLEKEHTRGYPRLDCAVRAANFKVRLFPGARVTFTATSEIRSSVELDGAEELKQQHAHELQLLEKYDKTRAIKANIGGPRSMMKMPAVDNDLSWAIRQLVLAADQFIITRAGGHSIVAGYHWFTDWARDTMISLPGLTLVTGRFDVARSILLTFSKFVRDGMLPNRFPEDGTAPTESDYNNADGTLWYFEAIRSYISATDDKSVVGELFPILEDIIQHHVSGTRFGIRQCEDGLLTAGKAGLALTWMDAKCGDTVVTPRRGKPVELQALWYNALQVMAYLARVSSEFDREKVYNTMAANTESSFQARLWSDNLQRCRDVVDIGPTNESDNTLRPNQLIAAALNWSPLTSKQRRSIVDKCAVALLTPYAIRTLPPCDSEYCARYEGGTAARDGAYHQGTAWPWLLGPFVMAHLHAYGDRARARMFLRPLLQTHLGTAGLGTVSEIFDADAPFRARGCIAQAWSVAELLRAWEASEPR